MKLSTIWSIPAMPLVERVRRTQEELLRRVAHRLPRSLAYWSFIDSGVRYMEQDAVVPEARYTDILQNFGQEVRA